MRQAYYLATNTMTSTLFISISPSKLLVSKFITCHLKPFYSSQSIHYNNRDIWGIIVAKLAFLDHNVHTTNILVHVLVFLMSHIQLYWSFIKITLVF